MRKMKWNHKAAILVMAGVLVVGGVGSGTLAWLTSSDSVTNTFIKSDVNVEINESKGSDQSYQFKMVPGWTIEKDPVVKVTNGSVDCWVFVKATGKMTKPSNAGGLETADANGNTTSDPQFEDYITWEIDTSAGWQPLTDANNNQVKDVWCQKATDINSDKEINVISGKKVTVKDSVTKEMMTYAETCEPTLSFTAYAVQLWKTNKPTQGANESDTAYATRVEAAQFTAYKAWCEIFENN